eukprot:1980783-Pleurochrysis_carterae.AAC.6
MLQREVKLLRVRRCGGIMRCVTHCEPVDVSVNGRRMSALRCGREHCASTAKWKCGKYERKRARVGKEIILHGLRRADRLPMKSVD